MKSWQLLSLLAAIQFAPAYFRYRWDVWSSLLGLTLAFVIWCGRGRRWSMLWLVSMWGVAVGLQVFACQAANTYFKVTTDQFEGVCDKITGLPLYTLGLMVTAGLASIWLERNHE